MIEPSLAPYPRDQRGLALHAGAGVRAARAHPSRRARLRAAALLAVSCLAGGCYTELRVTGVSFDRLVQTVRETEPLGATEPLGGYSGWSERSSPGRCEFTSTRSVGLAPAVGLVTAGLWIPLGTQYRVVVERLAGGHGVRLAVRRLTWHQVALLIPLLLTDSELELRDAKRLLERARRRR